MLRAAASVVGLTAVFVTVLYLAYSGDTVPAPSPTATPPESKSGPRSTATLFAMPALPDIFKGVELTALALGPEVGLPTDVALIVETGCFQCDGPTTGFARVYRDPFDRLRVEEIFRPGELDLGPRLVQTDKGVIEDEPRITGFGFAPDASEMFVAVCTRGFCGGDDFPSDDVRTTTFQSNDGGIRWTAHEEIDNDASIIGRTAPGLVLMRSYDHPGRGEWIPTTISTHPSNR